MTLTGRGGGTVNVHGKSSATECQMTVRVAMAAALVLAFPLASPASEVAGASAAASTGAPPGTARSSAATSRAPAAASDGLSVNPYAGISNERLADVADRWAALNQDERRWFFVEVRKRLMATDGAPAIPIGASARFGQVVRNRDGTVTRIETTRATAEPAATTNARDDPRAYGLGFERRLEVQGGPARSIEARTGPTPASVRLPASDRRPSKPEGGP